MKKRKKEPTTTTGFEPVRGDPKRFQVFRLNHSARLPWSGTGGRPYTNRSAWVASSALSCMSGVNRLVV